MKKLNANSIKICIIGFYALSKHVSLQGRCCNTVLLQQLGSRCANWVCSYSYLQLYNWMGVIKRCGCSNQQFCHSLKQTEGQESASRFTVKLGQVTNQCLSITGVARDLVYYGDWYRGLEEAGDKIEGLEEHDDDLEGLEEVNNEDEDLRNSARTLRVLQKSETRARASKKSFTNTRNLGNSAKT